MGRGPTTSSAASLRDDANYSALAADIKVSLDDVANDGAAGEGDNVRSTVEIVEYRVGQRHDHRQRDRQRPLHWGGNDTIFGGAGDDEIDAGAGADTLLGEAGNDFLSAGDSFGAFA